MYYVSSHASYNMTPPHVVVPKLLTSLGGVGCVLFCAYLAELVFTVVAPRARRLFTPRHARRHRVAGATYLALLVGGLLDVVLRELHHRHGRESESSPPSSSFSVASLASSWASVSHRYHLAFDVALGVAGTLLTLTAAYDFRTAHEAGITHPLAHPTSYSLKTCRP